MSLRIYFMYDCHIFAAVTERTGNNRSDVVALLERLFAEDGCGTAFARWGERNYVGPPLHGSMLSTGRYGVTRDDIEKFVDVALSYRPLLVDPGAA